MFVTKQRALELNQNLRRLAAEHGHQIRPEQLPVQVIAYVAETKEKAEEEAIKDIQFFFEDALRATPVECLSGEVPDHRGSNRQSMRMR